MIENKMSQTHDVKIIDRNFINLTGVQKIISFNDEEFLLESILGNIHIKGNDLEMIKMDTGDGIVKIKGHINVVMYLDGKEKHKEDSLIAKLFK